MFNKRKLFNSLQRNPLSSLLHWSQLCWNLIDLNLNYDIFKNEIKMSLMSKFSEFD